MQRATITTSSQSNLAGPADTSRSRFTTPLLALMLFMLAGLVIWNMPHGYSVDLSKVGKGEAVIVLVHDPGVINSLTLMRILDGLRDSYHDRVDFLVADVRTPKGQTFAQEHNVGPATVLTFAADGRRVAAIPGTQEPAALSRALRDALRELTAQH